MCAGHDPAKTAEPIEMQDWDGLMWAQKPCIRIRMHTGDTWRIHGSICVVSAMQVVATITVATCYLHCYMYTHYTIFNIQLICVPMHQLSLVTAMQICWSFNDAE